LSSVKHSFLGLQRAWAQPRRTDSSTCSATSSHRCASSPLNSFGALPMDTQ
jgi:hypothetical protein